MWGNTIKQPVARMLRPYQMDLSSSAIKYLLQGKDYCIALPAQTGKTITFFEVIKKGKFNALIVTPRKFITSQGADEAKIALGDNKVAYINSNTKKLDKVVKGKQVVVMDLLTAYNRLHKGLIPKDMFNLLIIDEAHYSAKNAINEDDKVVDMLKKVMSHCPTLNVTATPFNEKGQYLDTLGFIDDRFNPSYHVQNGFLSKLNFFIADVYSQNIEAYEGYKKHLVKRNDGYSETSVAKAINSKEGKILTEMALQHTFKNNVVRLRERALIYAGSIEQAEWIAREFKMRGHNAKTIHSKIKTKDRLNIIEDFNTNKFDILVSVDMLVMGIAIKNVKKSILYRAISSRVTYQQLTARGCGGDAKSTAISNVIVDYTDTYKRMGHPHDFIPYWGNDKPVLEKVCKSCSCKLKEFPMQSIKKRAESGFVVHIKQCLVCGYIEESERVTNEDELYVDSFNLLPVKRQNEIKYNVALKKYENINMSRISEIIMELENRNIDSKVVKKHLLETYKKSKPSNESLKKLNIYYDKCLKVAKHSSLEFIGKWVKSL